MPIPCFALNWGNSNGKPGIHHVQKLLGSFAADK